MTEEYTVNTIDSNLNEAYQRLIGIEQHLQDGIQGEHPKVADSSEKEEIDTPSLSSLNQRLSEVHTVLTRIENLTKSIHS